jgi:hypothetical protein
MVSFKVRGLKFEVRGTRFEIAIEIPVNEGKIHSLHYLRDNHHRPKSSTTPHLLKEQYSDPITE